MKDKEEMIRIITDMLVNANEEDLKLIIIFIEGYLRKKRR